MRFRYTFREISLFERAVGPIDILYCCMVGSGNGKCSKRLLLHRAVVPLGLDPELHGTGLFRCYGHEAFAIYSPVFNGKLPGAVKAAVTSGKNNTANRFILSRLLFGMFCIVDNGHQNIPKSNPSWYLNKDVSRPLIRPCAI